MSNLVSVFMLKPHPKNSEYFSAPSPEEREKIKKSIEANGIRDPLKVLPDYTVIAGHVRLEIAKELGIEKVPVEVWDIPPEEAEYLLVADNEERRICHDPMKKAKRAKFLKEYWEVRRGGDRKSKVENLPLKTLSSIAEVIGESEFTTKQLLKLNDLVPSLQTLVSEGKLSQTAAYSLAFLSPAEQERLLKVLGESGVCGLSVKEAQELRREIEAEHKRAEEFAKRLAETEKALSVAREGSAEAERLKAEIEVLRKENAELRARQSEIVEKVVEKVVYTPDPSITAQLEAARNEVDRLTKELSRVKDRMANLAADGERERAAAANLRREKEELEKRIEVMKRQIEKLTNGDSIMQIPLKKEIDRAASLATDMIMVLGSITNQKSKLKELVAIAKTSDPIPPSSDRLEARAAEFIAATTLHQVSLTLKTVASMIAEFLEMIDFRTDAPPRLRLVTKGSAASD
ncbi:MAG: ParB N-terminal domain-containing protein [Moorellaceae bacterium]